MRDRLLSKRAQGAQADQTGREEGQRRRLGHRLIDYIGYGRQRYGVFAQLWRYLWIPVRRIV
jgi:hypothetical protein